MQPGNPTRQASKVAAPAKTNSDDTGFLEVALIALAGLALSMIVVSLGFFLEVPLLLTR